MRHLAALVRRRRRTPAPVLEPAEAYAKWAPDYPPAAHNLLMVLEEAAVLSLLPPAPQTALDLACGTGRYARLLAMRGVPRIAGVDRSPAMLRTAARAGCPVAMADMRQLPIATATLDLVVCGLAMGDVPSIDPAIAEAARILRRGGVIVYSDLHPIGAARGWQRSFRDAAGRAWAVHHYVHDLATHRTACGAAGLTIDAIEEPRIDAGHRHRGEPAALVIRARRTS